MQWDNISFSLFTVPLFILYFSRPSCSISFIFRLIFLSSFWCFFVLFFPFICSHLYILPLCSLPLYSIYHPLLFLPFSPFLTSPLHLVSHGRYSTFPYWYFSFSLSPTFLLFLIFLPLYALSLFLSWFVFSTLFFFSLFPAFVSLSTSLKYQCLYTYFYPSEFHSSVSHSTFLFLPLHVPSICTLPRISHIR